MDHETGEAPSEENVSPNTRSQRRVIMWFTIAIVAIGAIIWGATMESHGVDVVPHDRNIQEQPPRQNREK